MNSIVHGARFRHVTADVRGARAEGMEDRESVERALEHVFDALGVQLAHLSMRRFEPQGTSWTLQGTHLLLVVHTWPEVGAATLDAWSDLDGVDAALETCARTLAAAAR